jgi:hypothetical protein
VGVLCGCHRRHPPGRVVNCAVHILRVRAAGLPWAVGAWGDRCHLEGVGGDCSAFGGGATSG